MKYFSFSDQMGEAKTRWAIQGFKGCIFYGLDSPVKQALIMYPRLLMGVGGVWDFFFYENKMKKKREKKGTEGDNTKFIWRMGLEGVQWFGSSCRYRS
jgi:hypothetical protein